MSPEKNNLPIQTSNQMQYKNQVVKLKTLVNQKMQQKNCHIKLFYLIEIGPPDINHDL